MRYLSLFSGIEAATVAWQAGRPVPRRPAIQGTRQQYGRAGDAVDRHEAQGVCQ